MVKLWHIKFRTNSNGIYENFDDFVKCTELQVKEIIEKLYNDMSLTSVDIYDRMLSYSELSFYNYESGGVWRYDN